MNAWLLSAGVLMLGLIPCLAVALRGAPADRLAGLQVASTVVTLVLLLFAQAFGASVFSDVALASALMAFPNGLVFARFFERWE